MIIEGRQHKFLLMQINYFGISNFKKTLFGISTLPAFKLNYVNSVNYFKILEYHK